MSQQSRCVEENSKIFTPPPSRTQLAKLPLTFTPASFSKRKAQLKASLLYVGYILAEYLQGIFLTVT